MEQFNAVSALVIMNAPKPKNEQCMVESVGLFLKEFVGVDAQVLFQNDPIVKSVLNKSINVQRMFINRYFNNLLLRFRSKTNIPVNEHMMMLIDDGFIDDWFKLFREIIIPFININKVFQVVYNK